MNNSIKLPKAFSQRMENMLGEEFQHFCSALSQTPPTSIRLNPYKNNNFIKLEQKVPWDKLGYYVDKINFATDPLWFAGTYYVQSASSMALTPMLEFVFNNLQKDNIKILDLAAAPGGKTLLTASIMPENSIIVANEINIKRTHILYENIAKWGEDRIITTNANPVSLLKLKNLFDIIILDAPCSAEGMFRKHPKYIKQWKYKNVISSAKIQRKLLQVSANILAPKGFLIYATCTYAPEENEQQLLNFIKDFPEFEIINLEVPEEWNWTKSYIYENKFAYRLYPHKVKGEGFFIALLQKKTGRKTKLQRQKLKYYGNAFGVNNTFIYENKIYSSKTLSLVEVLINYKVPVYSPGVRIAEIKKKNIIPTTEFVLWKDYSDIFPAIELDKSEALDFLRGNTKYLDSEFNNNFIVAKYEGVPLGLYKKVGNRLNNLYPQYWRLKM